MKIHHSLQKFSFTRPVVTVGMFDGVHLGHRFVIETLKKIAASSGGESVIISFWPHPRIVLGKTDHRFSLLNTKEEKMRLLNDCGVDHLLMVPFTLEFSRLTSDEFVKNVLVDQVGVKQLLVGANNHYGRNREGNAETISEQAVTYGFEIIRPDMLQLGNDKVSSTSIRNMLLDGDVSRAAQHLGYQYSLSGVVEEGDRLGRTIGYPTANIRPDEPNKLIPPDGVYAVTGTVDANEYEGMLYIGERPTLKKTEKKKKIEVHLFKFAADIYGKNLEIRFVTRVRGDIKFESLDALTSQLRKDETTIKEILKTKI